MMQWFYSYYVNAKIGLNGEWRPLILRRLELFPFSLLLSQAGKEKKMQGWMDSNNI